MRATWASLSGSWLLPCNGQETEEGLFWLSRKHIHPKNKKASTHPSSR